MKKLTILVGISGTGKSTLANGYYDNDPKNTVIVSRDKMREMLFGFSESNIHKYYSRSSISANERTVTGFCHEIILSALSQNKHVIVDATHLKKNYIDAYAKYNVPTDLVIIKQDLEVCIERDANRVRTVGESIIKSQLKQFNTLMGELGVHNKNFNFLDVKNYQFPVKDFWYEYDTSKINCIVVDVDGTIADNMGSRSPFDWGKVDQDVPKENVIDVVQNLRGQYHLIICTGRDGKALELTEKWLKDNHIQYDDIYIRENGDQRADYVVKEEMWREISKEFNIVAMFDDRRQVIDHARSLGFTVLDVANHTF